MPGRRNRPHIYKDSVFLNIPYGPSHERMLVAFTAALIAMGRDPRLTLQVLDRGQGRLRRIFDLIGSCPVSIHDLGTVGQPPRFNMPFELGLACAIREQTDRHDFMILEKKLYRFPKHLSDLAGVDPKIYHGTVKGAISAVLEMMERPDGSPPAITVMRLHRRLMKFVPILKSQHCNNDLFSARVYDELVTLGWIVAPELGLH